MSTDSAIINIAKSGSTFAKFGTPEIAAKTDAVDFIGWLYVAFAHGQDDPYHVDNKKMFTDDECAAMQRLILDSTHPGQYWRIMEIVRMPKVSFDVFRDAWNLGTFHHAAAYARTYRDRTERMVFIRKMVDQLILPICVHPSRTGLIDFVDSQIVV